MSKNTSSKSTHEPKKFKGEDATFTQACIRAGVKPTARQYRKWCRGFGSAHANRNVP